MKSAQNTDQARSTARIDPLAAVAFGLLVVLMLLAGATLSGAQISGETDFDSQVLTDPELAGIDDEDAASEAEEFETLTMEIPLKKGGSIDLKLHSNDVVIEKYDGEKILLIIESSRSGGRNSHGTTGTGPMDIQVTRNGKDVQIESVKGAGSSGLPLDVSFKIMVPSQDQHSPNNLTHGRVFYKLLSVMQRSLNRETLKWLM